MCSGGRVGRNYPYVQFPQVKAQTINVAGDGIFDFPREMTPDRIRDVLRKKFPSDKDIAFKAAVTGDGWRWIVDAAAKVAATASILTNCKIFLDKIPAILWDVLFTP